MSFLFGEKYDTIIVGGGIAGLFLAYKLKDTKQNILLIEKEGGWGGPVTFLASLSTVPLFVFCPG